MIYATNEPAVSVFETVRQYWMDVLHLFPLKAGVAATIVWFADATGLSATVALWYCAFTLIEFLVSTIEKVSYNQWSKSHLSHWLYRVTTQLVLAAMVGGIFHMVAETTGSTIAGINWVLLLCAAVDFGSIVDSLIKIGAPVPPFFVVLARGFKRKSAMYLGNALNDPVMRAELEKALGVENKQAEDDAIAPEIEGIPSKG